MSMLNVGVRVLTHALGLIPVWYMIQIGVWLVCKSLFLKPENNWMLELMGEWRFEICVWGGG